MRKNPSANMMDCAHAKEWVQHELDGERLSFDTKKDLEAHLALCEGCRAWASQMRTAVSSISYTLFEPQPSPGFRAQLLKKLGLSQQIVPAWLRWAAVSALGFAGIWILGVFFIGERVILPVAGAGLTHFPNIIRVGRHLMSARTGLIPSFSNSLDVVIVFLGALLILIALGIIAGSMLNRRSPVTPKSV